MKHNEDNDKHIIKDTDLSPQLQVKIRKVSPHSKFTIITVSQVGQDK